jgi:hypothetical protein
MKSIFATDSIDKAMSFYPLGYGNDRIAQTMVEGILPLITSYRATAR